MKKKVSLIILSLVMLLLSSCSDEPSAELLLSDFTESYGAEGIIYSSEKSLGEEGYVPEGLTEKIYIYEGAFPKNYAIFLNSHTHKGSEAAIFICKDEKERQKVSEMCLERMKTVSDGKDDRILIRCGNIIAYSTLEDAEKAEELLKKIISRHT